MSVVNALTAQLEVQVKRHGKVYQMAFAHGEKRTELIETGTVGKANTGTQITFYPILSILIQLKFLL